MYIISTQIINCFLNLKKKKLHKYLPLLQNISFCNCPYWEAQSPGRKYRLSFADAPDSDWNPKDQTSRTAQRSKHTFRNCNRSCWLLRSCKSGLYLIFACIQSRSNFSFNQFKSQLRGGISDFGATLCQTFPKKTLRIHSATCRA